MPRGRQLPSAVRPPPAAGGWLVRRQAERGGASGVARAPSSAHRTCACAAPRRPRPLPRSGRSPDPRSAGRRSGGDSAGRGGCDRGWVDHDPAVGAGDADHGSGRWRLIGGGSTSTGNSTVLPERLRPRSLRRNAIWITSVHLRIRPGRRPDAACGRHFAATGGHSALCSGYSSALPPIPRVQSIPLVSASNPVPGNLGPGWIPCSRCAGGTRIVSGNRDRPARSRSGGGGRVPCRALACGSVPERRRRYRRIVVRSRAARSQPQRHRPLGIPRAEAAARAFGGQSGRSADRLPGRRRSRLRSPSPRHGTPPRRRAARPPRPRGTWRQRPPEAAAATRRRDRGRPPGDAGCGMPPPKVVAFRSPERAIDGSQVELPSGIHGLLGQPTRRPAWMCARPGRRPRPLAGASVLAPASAARRWRRVAARPRTPAPRPR